MPEVFLRASGGWRGNAMEIYRKDRLPSLQARFAASLKSGKDEPRPKGPERPRRVIGRGSNWDNSLPAALFSLSEGSKSTSESRERSSVAPLPNREVHIPFQRGGQASSFGVRGGPPGKVRATQGGCLFGRRGAFVPRI